MLTPEEKTQFELLVKNCNEMIEGKFILADSKISKILKNITECKFVYDLLSNCMRDFNYEKEFARAKINKPNKGNYFAMPSENRKMLAMAFCLLVQIENRIIDFPDFLKRYFIRESKNEYSAFTNEVIKPLRDVLISIVDAQTEESSMTFSPSQQIDKQQKGEQTIVTEERKIFNNEEIIEEKNEKDYFDEIIDCSHEIIKTLMFDTKLKINLKDDATIIAEAMIEACKLNNLKLLNGLIIGFDKIACNIKSIKFIYKDMKNVMLEFYMFLQR